MPYARMHIISNMLFSPLVNHNPRFAVRTIKTCLYVDILFPCSSPIAPDNKTDWASSINTLILARVFYSVDLVIKDKLIASTMVLLMRNLSAIMRAVMGYRLIEKLKQKLTLHPPAKEDGH